MKIKKVFLQAVSAIICVALICVSSITALAQDSSVTFAISSAAYSEERGAYIAKEEFKSGEMLYLKLSATQIEKLGGMAFKIEFDNSYLTFMENKSVCVIDDSKPQYFLDAANSQITVTYENGYYDKNTLIMGGLFYLAFQVETLLNSQSASFLLEILDVYDNSVFQVDIESNLTDSTTVSLTADTISEETLSLFKKLENIKYPDSKEDIDAATAAFGRLSSLQKDLLGAKYPTEYEWLSTASTRYNRLAEQAGKDAILAEVNGFKKTHANALSKTVETVTLADENAVTKAVQSYANLSDAAKTYLQSEGKLLPALEERINELKDIKAEVDEFLGNEAYVHLWNREILENRFDLNYTNYVSFIQLALLNYDLLSDEAKQMVQSEYEWLSKLNDEANKYLALDEAAALLAEKTAQFQKTYLKVFMLNQNNVTESDRTAIEMVIAAYNDLDDEALKEALAPRIKNLNTLLEILDELAEESDGETVYVEVPGETVTVTERVEIPGETVTVTEKVEVPGETITVTETVEVAGETEYITKTDSLTNTIIRTLNQKSALSNMVLIMFVLLAVAVLILVVSYVICKKYRKKFWALNSSDDREAVL